MAVIRQIPSGKWQAIVRLKGHPQQSRTFFKKYDADVWARQIENEIDRGVFVSRDEAERTTIAEAIDRYVLEVLPKKRGATKEISKWRKWKNDNLSKHSLASIKSSDLSAWRDKKLNEGFAPATVKQDLSLMSSLFNTAIKDWGIHAQNPIKTIRMPKVANGRDRRLVGDEEQRLIDELSNTKCSHKQSNKEALAVFILSIEMATRLSELISLNWNDINLKNRTAKIRGKGGSVTKNGDEYRHIPLSNRAVEVLNEIYSLSPLRKDGKVFNTTESAIQQCWRRAKKRAEIGDLRFHDLRHEATSRLADKLSTLELASVTGHKDLRSLKRYAHIHAVDLVKKIG